MNKGNKNIPQKTAHQKNVSSGKHSTDSERVQWRFDKLEKAGKFAFDLARVDFDHREVLEKIIAYSNMTWSEVKAQTHDKNKSKHHFLDLSKLSAEGRSGFYSKGFEGKYEDSVFSFAFQNKLRIIGIRENERFYAVWFDPMHEFCPSQRR